MPPKIPLSAQKVLECFQKKAFSLHIEKLKEHPIYGTTLYIATTHIETLFGPYTAYIFQDTLHKGYIIALAYGNIFKEKILYTRVHSSCVTSETLRGCDCDCVQQLEGALEYIAKKGAGILFYSMQEGRGVGYIAKARDRMLVQATRDEISTFDAYQALGLRKDYRQYRNIRPICKLLKIDPEFILLTNNPDKVAIIKSEGIKVKKVETLDFEPGPYNLAYLTSKLEMGHILDKTADAHITRVHPPEAVIPFKPYAIPEAERFIYAASYCLPIKPINDEIILTAKQYASAFKNHPIDKLIEGNTPLIASHELLRKNRYKIKLCRDNFLNYANTHPKDELSKIRHIPAWFRVHAYFDVVTGDDFVVLTYGKPQKHDIPVIRVHSESLFNRFPLIDNTGRIKYKAALQEIIKYGVGMLILLYNDGRGAGFGAYAEDLMWREKEVCKTTNESYKKLGISYDTREYDAAMMFVKHHFPRHKKVQMVMSTPDSLINKTGYAEAINKYNIQVTNWIFLKSEGV